MQCPYTWEILIPLTVLMVGVNSLSDLGYSLEWYDESPGVYYENKGVAALYNVEWKTVVYIHVICQYNNTSNLRLYVDHIDALCQTSTIRNWTECTHFGKDIQEKLTRLLKVRELLQE